MGKKRRNQPIPDLGIPQSPTAKISASVREEILSDPEEFHNTSKVAGNNPSTDGGTNLSDGSNNLTATGSTAPVDVNAQADVNNSSVQPNQKGSTKKPKGPGNKRKKTKRKVRITKKNDIQSYESDFLRNFTESTGTHSYDSPRSTKSFFRYVCEGKLVETAPLTLMIARKAVSETKPEVSRKIEVINQPQFSDILKADNAPEFGEYETVSSKFYEAVQQQELVKEMILNTLSDYFAAQRDDLILSIQVKRQGARPIFNIQLVKPVDVAEAKKKSNEKTMVPALSLYDEWNKKEVAGSKPKARHICHRRRNMTAKATSHIHQPNATTSHSATCCSHAHQHSPKQGTEGRKSLLSDVLGSAFGYIASLFQTNNNGNGGSEGAKYHHHHHRS